MKRLQHHLVKRPKMLIRSALLATRPGITIVHWPDEGRVVHNWGDKLNPYLVTKMTGRPCVHRPLVYDWAGRGAHFVIGSMLGKLPQGVKCVVWGPGFMDFTSVLKVIPAEIHAVRGPLSRAKVLEAGVACPDVVGDPALLCPLFYTPPAGKTHDLGVIPHYKEQDDPRLEELRRSPGVKIIDITGPIEGVIDEIASCERIVSSSLHGLIAADAYGVPSRWVKLTGAPMGDGFKFFDYLASVGRDEQPLQAGERLSKGDLLSEIPDYSARLDLRPLIEACPFLSASRAKTLVERLPSTVLGRKNLP